MEKRSKFLLLFASYDESDFELFVDCLGTYDTMEEAEAAQSRYAEEDEERDEVEYKIKEITL